MLRDLDGGMQFRGLTNWQRVQMSEQPLHFLHIPKTGGTALRHALVNAHEYAGVRPIFWSKHKASADDILRKHKSAHLGFFVRDPVERFISGFYSRKREGQPRYHVPWSAAERLAFHAFGEVDLLAEGLAQSDPLAEAAVKSIRHTAPYYVNTFKSKASINQIASRIAFVGQLETLEEDFDLLRRWLGLPKDVELPSSPVEAHRSDPSAKPNTSKETRTVLAKFLSREYRIYERCLKLRASRIEFLKKAMKV
ncbi:MAG: sulfotransferase family 2 domain-containing protein [Paracoccaceae bacterium]